MRLLALLVLGSLSFACGEVDQPAAFKPGYVEGAESEAVTTKKPTAAKPAPSAATTAAAPAYTAVPAPAPAQAAVPAPADAVWTGTLAKTDFVEFGGDPYCTYRTHLEDVKVSVKVAPDGTINGTTVTANAIEEGLNNCPNAPIAPNLHHYASTTPSKEIAVEGDANNLPRAKMTATLDPTGSIAITWHRDDIDAPFDWTLTATVPVTPN